MDEPDVESMTGVYSEARPKPVGQAPMARSRLAYIGVLIGVFMIVLDTTVVNVAVPGIQHDLRGTVTGLQWVVNGYNLMFAALLLTAGALADRLGGRKVFGIGTPVFAAASLACGFAPTLAVLITARVAQESAPHSCCRPRSGWPAAFILTRALAAEHLASGRP
ncbi:hypothetical protein GCM10027569_92190 [Flindersiella endophytica]